MLRDDCDEIIALLDSGKIKSNKHVQDLLNKIIFFTRSINHEFEEGNDKDKAELIQLLAHMQKKLQKRIREFCLEQGISEEELASMAKETSALNSNQKSMLDSAEKEIKHIGQNIRKYNKKKHPEKVAVKKPETKSVKKTQSRAKWKKT